MRAYIEHVDEHRQQCIEWLGKSFAAKEPKPKGKKEKAGATAQNHGDPE
jgi:hypothetical protein